MAHIGSTRSAAFAELAGQGVSGHSTDRIVAIRCEASDALDPDAQLIELAAVTVQHGRITDDWFHTLLNPQTPIPKSGTLVHGHSKTSLAGCPVWKDVAASWMAYAQGAQLLVWNAKFHLCMLDRAQRRAVLPAMHTLVAGITDLREMLHTPPDRAPARLQDVLAGHQISCNTAQDGLPQEAEQLAHLWLAMSGANRP
jgi:DNA polymerase III epsilon subunit-like protein